MHFLRPSSKNKKNQARKKSLYFRKWNFVALILKKKLLYFSKESFSYISAQARKIKKHSAPRKFLMLRKKMGLSDSNIKEFLIFQETEIFLYFRKRSFVIFWEMHIQNHSIFRTESIFRNLRYLELEAYL